MRNPYVVLGVSRRGSDEEIKRAYRRLAKRLHPDLNPGKAEIAVQFQEVNAAYELLSDPLKRRRFDRGEIDADGRERDAGPRVSPAEHHAAESEGISLDDVFQHFLRRGRRAAGARTAEPRATSAAPAPQRVLLTFLEAALGGTRPVTLPDGRSVEVAIPAGIDTGQTLRLRDAQAGDAFLEIAVELHPLFTRKERDIHVEVPVALVDAVLGTTLTVPTIHGDVTVKVPKGSSSGALLRLRGKGIAAGVATGDEYVRLRVMLPDPPDPELDTLLEIWAERQAAKARGGAS
jgi:DnaJ-class molecular chaperone